MFIAGSWRDLDEVIEVRSPYDGELLDTVPRAGAAEVELALEAAVRGAAVMAGLSAHERAGILSRAATLIEDRREAFARTITREAGKTIHEARAEVLRAVETLRLSAEEAKRLYGETLPLDADPGGAGKVGFTMRVPCGVVVAITPFNFPLNLVCHKVGPALAAGNAVIVKPAEETPLAALGLVEVLLEAGAPPESIQCITGYGEEVGTRLVADGRVRKISFTGSRAVGETIARTAGLKRVTMELGSNSPLIVMPDGDLHAAAMVAAAHGYANAGQVCISAQRVLVAREVYDDFLAALTPMVRSIVAGDPLDESVTMGPMIRAEDAARVNAWILEAADTGARILAGGEYEGTLHAPTLVADVRPEHRIFRDELFGPAVAVLRFDGIDEAIDLANRSEYGLSAGVFTENVRWAMEFARRIEAGNVMINAGPQWRADLMPYGGLKGSGLGKEGPRYAVLEMTELKTIVFH